MQFHGLSSEGVGSFSLSWEGIWVKTDEELATVLGHWVLLVSNRGPSLTLIL